MENKDMKELGALTEKVSNLEKKVDSIDVKVDRITEDIIIIKAQKETKREGIKTWQVILGIIGSVIFLLSTGYGFVVFLQNLP